MKPIQGGCLCGAVRYTATAEPIMTRTCWCRVCQYFAAGNASVNVVFAKDAVTIEGTLTDFPSSADSGNAMHRRFCPRCGTQVTSESEARAHLIILRAGTLDDPETAKSRRDLDEVGAELGCIDPYVPHFEGQPPAPPSAPLKMP